jgi:hypothetical protein
MPTRSPSRVNVVVSKEQHALLLELASLDQKMSASRFLRELLDQVTPLLRTTVPMMRAAKEAHGEARQRLKDDLRGFITEIDQMDLLDAPAAPGASATQRSEDGRANSRKPRGAK